MCHSSLCRTMRTVTFLSIVSSLFVFAGAATTYQYVWDAHYHSNSCPASQENYVDIFLVGGCYAYPATSQYVKGTFVSETNTDIAISLSFYPTSDCSGKADSVEPVDDLNNVCEFSFNFTDRYSDDYYGLPGNVVQVYNKWFYSETPPSFAVAGTLQP